MRYEAPESLDSAVALLAAAGGSARVLAGGTDLLVQLRTDMIEPALVVDIKGIAELRTDQGGGRRVPRRCRRHRSRTEGARQAQAAWPGVVEAANLIGSTQVQGRATMGGNLCNGSPAADSVPALIAAGAKAIIAGPKGRRELAGRGRRDWRRASLPLDQGRVRRRLPACRPNRRTPATPTCASFRAPRWISPSSAAASR